MTLTRLLLQCTRWLLPTCQQASRWSSDALTRELSLLERLRLRQHLLVCRFCRRYHRQIRWLHRVLHAPMAETPRTVYEPLSAAARQRLIDRLRETEEP